MFTICGCPQMEHISPAAAWYFLFICVQFSARRAENRTLTIIKYRSAEGKKKPSHRLCTRRYSTIADHHNG
jgi:hypothetical protein